MSFYVEPPTVEVVPVPDLHVRMLGPFTVQVHGTPLPALHSRKGSWLLALLVLKHAQSLDRNYLAATLWPDSDHSESLKNLRNTLSNLRCAMGPLQHYLQSPSPRTLRLDLSNAVVDLPAFDRMVKQGSRDCLAAAVALYRGPLLEGCEEEWVIQEREQRQQTFLDAMQALAGFELEAGEAAQAVQRLRTCIGIDPFRETAQCALMQALAAEGDYAGVTQAYREFRLLLHDQLHVQPAGETIALYQTIRVLAGKTAAGGAPPKLPKPQHHTIPGALNATERNQDFPVCSGEIHNLPPFLTSFIGREKEQAEVEELLANTRLLTLTGTGGSGKTRLSLEVAGRCVGAYLSEVWIVELDSISDPALVLRAVAAALNVREKSGEPLLQTIVTALRSRTLLLLLDNCEHQVAPCRELAAAILRGCPSVRLLVTSRVRLGIAGEQTYLVPPLTIPDLNASLSMDAIRRYESVRLFEARAGLTRSDYRITPENASAVAHVCYRLDGLPLAIELAAARVRTLSVADLQRRLDDRFGLLTGGDRSATPRQQTLRSLIDWSFDLLSVPEQQLFQRLSVFAGGWTLEAAEQICALNTRCSASSTQQSATSIQYSNDVLDLLTSLVDNSLVIAEERGSSVRYRMLETICRYGFDRLIESGEQEELHSRHLAYFLAFAEEVEPQLTGAEQAMMLQRLEAEHDNLRRAIYWCTLGPRSSECLRLCGALSRFWWTRGYVSEGLEWSVRALGICGGEDRSPERAKALNGAGGLACFQGDYDSARRYLEEGLAIERALEHDQGIANSLNGLGNVAYYQNDLVSSRAYYQESLAIFRKSDDRKGISASLSNLGMVSSSQRDYASAQLFYEESLAMFMEIGNRSGTAQSLNNLGNVAYYLGNYGDARARYEESLAVRRDIGDWWGIAQSLNNLGNVMQTQGDPVAAQNHCEESLAICQEIGDRKGVADSLRNLATVAHARGDYAAEVSYSVQSLTIRKELGDKNSIADLLEVFAGLAEIEHNGERAVALWRAAETLRESIGPLLPHGRSDDASRHMAILQNTMLTDAYCAAYEKGSAMTLDDAIALAMHNS